MITETSDDVSISTFGKKAVKTKQKEEKRRRRKNKGERETGFLYLIIG